MRVTKFRLALPAALSAASLFMSAGTAGAGTPSATVKPSRKLTNGQTVTVNFKGFNAKKDESIEVVQCNYKLGTAGFGACDLNDAQVVVPGTKSGTVQLTVHTGAIGTNGVTCGTTRSDAKNCLVEVAGIKGHFLVPGQAAGAPIAFKIGA
jgi:Neocarzinostatin family